MAICDVIWQNDLERPERPFCTNGISSGPCGGAKVAASEVGLQWLAHGNGNDGRSVLPGPSSA
jgi:hypothetical protein